MKFFLGIGNIDKNIIFMLIGGLLRFFVNLFLGQDILSSILNHTLVMNFSTSLGLMLSFIPMIIYKIRNKEMNCCVKNVKYDLVYNNLYEALIYGKYKWILLSSFIDFIQNMVIQQFCMYCRINMWIFDILFISIFSFIIFKIKLYLHHYISVLLIIFVGISLDIYLKLYYFNDADYVVQMLCKFISEIALSMGLVIDKYTMEKKFCSPYEICFYHGLINFSLSLILLSFSREIGLDNYDEFFLNPSFEKFYAFMIFMVTQFVFNIFIFIINKNTTPCHILIMVIIGQFAPYIRALTKDTKSSIILLFGLLVILFFALVFNEILEINCLGLQKNTKKNISIRAKMDRLSVGKISYLNDNNGSENDDDNDNEDSNDDNDENNEEEEQEEDNKINDSQQTNPLIEKKE